MQRKKEEIAKRIKDLREKEARDRAKREQEAKQKREKEAREKEEREREIRERIEKEKRIREEHEREIREKLEKEARIREKREREIRERLEKESREARERLEKEARETRQRLEREAREAKEKQEREAREAKEKQEREAREKEQREKEQRERAQQEKARREKELRDKRLQEARERELRDRLEREKALREKLEREAKEREAREREAKERETREREAKEREAAQLKEAEAAKAAEEAKKAKEAETTRRGTYAFSSVGEKTNPWPNGKPPVQAFTPAKSTATPSVAPSASPSATQSTTSSGTRRPPPPTAQSARGTDDDAYSYRPYDQPKAHTRRRSGETIFTESSYAPSQSTSRTTPPPSVRGPYTTKDPDKIVIKAVYGFLNQFSKTPASQLVSGVGHVTDGLILRITTEGLFIDDDVRGVPQREWDVKAWTLKLMEVWCPAHTTTDANASPRVANKPAPRFKYSARGQSKALMGDDADAYLTELLHACKDDCRLVPHGGSDGASSRGTSQAGEWKHRGLHVLRATIRDQEGKRFLFVLGEEEGWKVAVGLQRLRKGTQVRQLGIQPMPQNEARIAVETLGW
ncbi:hypothetical protein O1611_g10080 [Lasiodiplodia mahajangana]|uniref:Uncharacterized protein n=1 Tax=Lasiodiplodia mahajangana TaxID=1108764 RepID=A0ACC2J277_9PEZI|nr:hypothetical protein O1611_g10080 [Lasiodiplodia mahajangana]